jgi:isocitrate lyase
MRKFLLAALLLAPLLSGCAITSLASSAVDVVTLPVKAVSAGVDAVTTSQSEADQKRGKQLREDQERRGRALRQWEARCAKLTRENQPCPPRPD